MVGEGVALVACKKIGESIFYPDWIKKYCQIVEETVKT